MLCCHSNGSTTKGRNDGLNCIIDFKVKLTYGRSSRLLKRNMNVESNLCGVLRPTVVSNYATQSVRGKPIKLNPGIEGYLLANNSTLNPYEKTSISQPSRFPERFTMHNCIDVARDGRLKIQERHYFAATCWAVAVSHAACRLGSLG